MERRETTHDNGYYSFTFIFRKLRMMEDFDPESFKAYALQFKYRKIIAFLSIAKEDETGILFRNIAQMQGKCCDLSEKRNPLESTHCKTTMPSRCSLLLNLYHDSESDRKVAPSADKEQIR
ncbi:MAG: hypothetical protein ACLTRS_09950 [Lachnospiraceae bacterium]